MIIGVCDDNSAFVQDGCKRKEELKIIPISDYWDLKDLISCLLEIKIPSRAKLKPCLHNVQFEGIISFLLAPALLIEHSNQRAAAELLK